MTGRRPSPRAPRGLVAVLLVIAVAAALAGCGGGKAVRSASPTPAPTWFAGCPAPTGGPVTDGLPRVSLPCFTGGASVALDRGYGKPTVINLWASWCPPCRAELPHVQAYAEQVAGRVTVLTVDVQDTRSAGQSFAQEAGVTLPTLYDEKGALLRGVGRSALPVTLLLDASGRLVYTYNAQALTVTALAALVAQHLHVTAG